MRNIEAHVFAAGMPVASLMEKVGGLIAYRIQALYSCSHFPRVGILVGPGHNGGDALVVARELYFRGYDILIHRPLAKSKELTTQQAQYVESLGMPFFDQVDPLQNCNLLVDGLFGFGLERSLQPPISDAINQINQWSQPVLSIDLPSGLHTDTGVVLGTAIRAERTFCLGLWKLGLLQDQALEFTGTTELIDFDLPLVDILAVLGDPPPIQRLTRESAIAQLPLPRPSSTHKYKMGHLLLICGSHRYLGGAILTGLGARASGVGMLSIAVPDSLKPLLSAQLPEALIQGCPETATGAIARLPEDTDLSSFHAIACGPGLTMDASSVVQQVLDSDRPLVLDADGLNVLAQQGTVPTLLKRQAPTILTPHPGEFKRLFPEFADQAERVAAVRLAAQETGAVTLLKGARVAIANPQGSVWINPESTPALARGGSGDVLTGLVGGILAQTVLKQIPVESAVQSAVWWHAQAGILAAQERTELGVDAFTLTQFLLPALKAALGTEE
jgi:NAD(P)H-hydrate epimerase